MDVLILGAPIVHDGKQIGVYAIYQDITERKRAEEIRIRAKEQARMARNIQMHFLPESDPEVQGYDISGKSIPAQNVGGDYFDFIWLDDHRLAISLGDVSGKGLAASLVMANLQATIRGQALFNAVPEKCLEGANKLLFKSIDSRTFVTLFYGILDTKNHTFSYSNAGHEHPIVFPGSGNPFQLKTHGLALGLKKDVKYKTDEISLNVGDRVLMCTDGVREAMNRQKLEFGEDRIYKIVQASDAAKSRSMINSIFASVVSHLGGADQNDDMTVVILNRES
jgi:sigma-B regulation protein RsbU (phosphoserine phosphatase)